MTPAAVLSCVNPRESDIDAGRWATSGHCGGSLCPPPRPPAPPPPPPPPPPRPPRPPLGSSSSSFLFLPVPIDRETTQTSRTVAVTAGSRHPVGTPGSASSFSTSLLFVRPPNACGSSCYRPVCLSVSPPLIRRLMTSLASSSSAALSVSSAKQSCQRSSSARALGRPAPTRAGFVASPPKTCRGAASEVRRCKARRIPRKQRHTPTPPALVAVQCAPTVNSARD